MNGPMMERLNTRENCLLLLGFLCTELMAARMEVDQNPERNKLIVQVRESGPAKDLKSMLILLSFAKPPPTITPLQLFSKIEPKIKDLTKNVPAHVLGKPILKGLLSDIQWQNIEAIGQELEKEYTIRRQMLIKRLDVTIQSFNWSQRMKGKQDEMVKAYRPIRCMLLLNMDIGVADVLSARDDLIKDEKVSSSNTRKKTQCAVNKVLMGRVPDRGGRPYEAQPPPAEMPFFKKREAGGQGGGRGGGGGGWGGGYRGGGGGRGDQGGGYRGGGGRGGRGGRGGGGGGGGVYNQPHHGQGGTFQQYGGGEDRGGGGGYGRGGGGHRY
ncbi:PREDICTED: protein FAM98A-like [Priapulus caudatus]|uniref:Protein FAM98A-like n=1 Tax=Priapulus caudatus TaxID=37621 RepID=A0ABM1ES33_PRICU|nr:PREDICTED: protein FAM98A-like [Priapulus caudatus]